MTVKELIKILIEYPQDLPIRVDIDPLTCTHCDWCTQANRWIDDTECHATGSSGYEISGEVILKISE